MTRRRLIPVSFWSADATLMDGDWVNMEKAAGITFDLNARAKITTALAVFIESKAEEDASAPKKDVQKALVRLSEAALEMSSAIQAISKGPAGASAYLLMKTAAIKNKDLFGRATLKNIRMGVTGLRRISDLAIGEIAEQPTDQGGIERKVHRSVLIAGLMKIFTSGGGKGIAGKHGKQFIRCALMAVKEDPGSDDNLKELILSALNEHGSGGKPSETK